MSEQSKGPSKSIAVHVLKLVLGFLGGIALLALFAYHVRLGLVLTDAERLLTLGSAIGSFGISVHGALKLPTGAPS